MSPAAPADAEADALVADIRVQALGMGAVVAVAESLTGGALSVALARGGDAHEWFAGGVTAYRNATKHRVLGVPDGPVVTPEAARAMAHGVLRLTGADVAVAVTGVGGPGPEEGRDPGTVFMCTATARTAHDFVHVFEGEPEEVVAQTVVHALRHVSVELRELDRSGSASPSSP